MAYVQPEAKVAETSFENLRIIARNMIERYKQFRLYSKTVSELRSLNGRDLADLGLSRSMIESVAFDAVYEGRQDRATFS
jgi:uncharacterized protein YjiS (DUF1127 family)